jgi:uncharacterized NAD-dependent epimerase/dehydratase family protein
VIGVAPTGGQLPDHWQDDLEAALEAGLDVVSGLHTRLGSFARLRAAAESRGVRLIDVRQPTREYPVASGRKRSGKRVLTVGTDCTLGKKYTALALQGNRPDWDPDRRQRHRSRRAGGGLRGRRCGDTLTR